MYRSYVPSLRLAQEYSRRHLPKPSPPPAMAAQPTADAAKPLVDHLTALPPELLTAIIKELPVREICRTRCLSRCVKAVIDDNQQYLLRPIIKEHRARIETDHMLIFGGSKDDLFSAVKNYLNYYGCNPRSPILASIRSKFGSHYAPVYSQRVNSPISEESLGRILSDTIEFSTRTDPEAHARLLRSLEVWFSTSSAIVFFSQLWDLKDVLVSRPSRCPEKLGFPQHRLASNTTANHHRDFQYASFGMRPCTLNTLQLPKLPSTRFSYRNQTAKLWHLARSKMVRTDALSLFEEAALLEDIFIW